MHLQRRVKIQFAIFAVIGLTAMTVLAFGYGNVAAVLWNSGYYRLTLHLSAAGGLYDRANVTYRGSAVGQVSGLTLVPDGGVQATLRIRSGVSIPSNSTAEVHSQSAIGEQYVALVPGAGPSQPFRDGATIEKASVPPDVNQQLDTLNTALSALPRGDLRTLVDESFTAFNGMGPQLSRAVDAADSLAIDANANLGDLTNVIDHSGPLLDSQAQTSDAIGAWARHLAIVSGELHQQDSALAGTLEHAGPAARAARALLDRVKPSVPVLLANLVSFADVGIVYNAHLEQMLVLFPQAMAELGATVVPDMDSKQSYRGAMEQFTTDLNLPPPCTTGYLPAQQRLSPAIQDVHDRPDGDFYCRIPQDSHTNVRGARNIPCEGKPGRRAPLVWMCENDIDYVPLNDGYNWKGDPNATASGQDVPQRKPDALIPGRRAPASPDGTPPPTTPPTALGVADYNPVDGTYQGPDGQVYTQENLAHHAAPPTLRSVLAPVPPKN